MKVCKKCGLAKSFDQYQRDADKPDGYRTRCKTCTQMAQKLRRRPNKWPSLAAFDAEEHVGALDDVTVIRTRVNPDDGTHQVRAKPVVEEVTPVEEHRLRRKIRELESANKALVSDLSNLQLLGDVVCEAQENPVAGITPREVNSGLREATALVCGSDWHIDEVIEPGQVNGRNRYNPEISARRMERFFESILWAINSQRETFVIRDLVLWLGGDLITNYLHDDNVLTNAMSPPEALAFAQAAISDGIRYLLTDPELERIVIPCNDGNHGRMSKRLGSSSRTMMSLEIMLYRMLAREFVNEPRVQFIIAEGEHLYYEVYGRTIRFVHGDSIKYSGGIGGITIPIFKALASWNTIRHSDLTALGHFHQRIVLPDMMVNGSLIGYGPFSLTIRARFEPPSQNFSLLEPKRFRSLDMPLWVSERTDDNDFYV